MSKNFYITTPIYYPNSKLHLGHVLTTVMADVIARYKKLINYDNVYFITGSDEYGQKIEKIALNKKIKPIEYTNKIVCQFKALWKKLHIQNDDFIRTTEERHYKTVQYIFKKIYEKGDIYKSNYEGFYCISCETFYKKNKVNNNLCPDCGKKINFIKEKSYFFKLSKYQDKLLNYIKNNPDFIQPEFRKNEMINFIEQGLEDMCISRNTFSWGIPMHIDKGYVFYVWFDALINYLTGINYIEKGELYEKFWLNNDEIIHFIGIMLLYGLLY